MNNTNTTCEIDVVIGSNIRRVRELAGVSRRGLAKAVGVSWSQLKKCEDGARRIAAGSLFAVARALNCSMDEFWRGIDTGEPTVLLPEQSDDAMMVARNFDRIPSPAHRDAIANLIATLADGGALQPAAE
ncbi:helix-turn-helix domain-containing protein [Sinorhizobium medicae]|uniref:helix-turn-helix domain-containing protein n=1 Tax=Sinorhizobium medicae TaxID=110321 RepID=UPI000C7D408E|nr:helix-turn-helix transcriptional regulator [Sinorhizobium medicae]MDX0865618.1 helix-turn-helix domain-containing protein [Sinorhizobium medicae]MDX0923882.1 helix-turn-helix domain-containing protein [Sinorhizobium medicae]MDX0930604.1 helix-turn-helix domain-containing protein [Sinorhizobium medicae]MQU78480.1 helix-turn-helix domain-containing protein [Sinorhizobium medicae]PLT90059.1 transcriptional regulator [Sinorhizobium medicae]